MLRIVAATRHDPQGFRHQTLLGRALDKLSFHTDLCVEVACGNSNGLPDVFNAALARAPDSDVLVFTHDDVRIDDWHLPQRVRDALVRYPVVGVAGNRRRVAGQPSWAFIDAKFTWDARENLSGAVAHINGGAELVSYYGPTPSSVTLLDGVFLAAKARVLRQAGITFDPLFRFHFYDLDFCRSCERAGLELGTWPIAITHASGGQFGSPEWKAAYVQYLDKWKK